VCSGSRRSTRDEHGVEEGEETRASDGSEVTMGEKAKKEQKKTIK
jgi:hypothetical protein